MIEQTNKDLFGFNFAALANMKTDNSNNNVFDIKSKKDIELRSIQIDSDKSISGHLVTNNLESLNVKSDLSYFSTQNFSKNFLLYTANNNTQSDLVVGLNQLKTQNNINNFTLKNNSKLFSQLDTETTTKLNNQVLEKVTNNTNLNALGQLAKVDNEPLIKLNARVDPKDNSENFLDFTKKVFSLDTLKETLDFTKDLGIGLGKFTLKNVLNALIPDIKSKDIKKLKTRFNNDDSLLSATIQDIIGKPVVDKLEQKYYEGKEEKTKVVGKYQHIVAGDIASVLELAIVKKLGISTEHKVRERQDLSNLFKSWITSNPLLGQHQFNLTIKSLANLKITKDLVDVNTIEKNLTFRVQGIKIPDIKRNVSNMSYGHSLFSNINNLQASTENKADLEIICDKNLDTLEYIIRLAGLGVCENFNENTQTKTYDLSTISDSNFNEETYNCAFLDIYNGRDLAKSVYMENLEWEFEKTGITKKALNIDYLLDAKTNTLADQKQSSSTSEKVVYAMLPQFYFENFKIVNVDYSFSFEAGSSAKLLKLKTTCTWSKMYIDWVSPERYFYDTVVQNTVIV